jgi:hypothetical protein
MDLNYLYFRHQISLVRAERAACGASRSVHADLARLYDSLIDGKRAHARSPLAAASIRDEAAA